MSCEAGKIETGVPSIAMCLKSGSGLSRPLAIFGFLLIAVLFELLLFRYLPGLFLHSHLRQLLEQLFAFVAVPPAAADVAHEHAALKAQPAVVLFDACLLYSMRFTAILAWTRGTRVSIDIPSVLTRDRATVPVVPISEIDQCLDHCE